jgi:elongator complex protein 3
VTRYRFEPTVPGTTPRQQAAWEAAHGQPLPLEEHQADLLRVISEIRAAPHFDARVHDRILRRTARRGQPLYTKDQLVKGYHALVEAGLLAPDDEMLRRLRVKPTRTLSGVAPVTVLTEPHPCPGECIFCPTEARMPKSYLSNEPGAMRALMLDFDPHEQTVRRIEAMQNIGHSTGKIELLVLGGTWSSYPRHYQEWFVRRCFDGLNGRDTPAETLQEAHAFNEKAAHRSVGLVVETRPDLVTPDEVHHLRALGVTKVQLGVQSLDDEILRLNKRGHGVEEIRCAMRLLRGAGFKLALHWMPNLFGATPESDLADFRRLWADPALRPDELKIYPTALLRGTELYEHYERGAYRPYDEDTLTDLLAACKSLVPPTCRINRVMRDIPAGEIADGVTRSNLRQVVQERLRRAGTPCRCIRCREVRGVEVVSDALALETLTYDTDHSHEVFLSAVTPGDRLVGYARLSLPLADDAPVGEIRGHALIRQVQVHGPALPIGDDSAGRAQHSGVGAWLIGEAKAAAREAGYTRLSVISAVGTREYYRRHGFALGELYMTTAL